MDTKERRTPGNTRKPPASGGARKSGSNPAAKPGQPQRKPAGSKAPSRKPGDARRQTGRPAASGRQNAKAAETRRQPRRTAENQPSPDVVYVQPTPFNKARFFLCIGIAVAVVLAIIFGMAIFFKVDDQKILVSGTNKYTAAQIVEASGIKDGDSLFLLSEAQVTSRILDKLHYVDRVRVGIKLPDTVKIEIEELEVVYSIADSEGGWWLLRADGRVVEKTNSAEAQQHTRILGIQIAAPIVGAEAVAWSEEESSVYPAEKLAAACNIVECLEDYGIIGKMTSIDVENTGDISLMYGEGNKILLGDTSEMSAKIRMLSGILQSGQYDSGILDISSPERVEARTS